MEKGNEVLFQLELITKLMKGCNGVMEYNWRLGAVLHSMYCVLYADCLKSYCDCEQCRTIIKALSFSLICVRHDIAEILLMLALSINQSINH